MECSSSHDWTKTRLFRSIFTAIARDARYDKMKCGCRGRGRLSERLNNFARFEERARPAMCDEKRERIRSREALVGEM